MEDVFKPSSLTIKQLFGNTDALYQIPRYQRPYSWGDDQLEKLWEDLIEAIDTDPNYFLGSIITAKPEESSSYLDIVDGQQRLTTLTILLCVYRDLYPNINASIIDEDPFAIDSKVLESSIKFNDRFERLRLRTHSHHQSLFEKLILKGNTTEIKAPKKKDLKKEEPEFKFQNSAVFFIDKLTQLGEFEAGKLLNYLFNKVKIIRIDCQSVSFAIKLFQVLNDRGLDLTNADLIKSFLIGKIQKIYEINHEVRKHKEDQFMDDWKTCESVASETNTSINDLFVMYEYYLLGQNPKKSLYEELVTVVERKDPNTVIADFLKFIKIYKNELFDKEDKLVYSFWYLRWTMYWRTILTCALHENYPEYKILTQRLRRYYYLHWIAGNTLSHIKQTSFNLIKSIKEKKSISVIEEELEQHLLVNNTVNRAIDNLNEDIYNEPWCKPLLFLIEYSITDDSSLVFYHDTDKTIQIEHIIPKAHKKNSSWDIYDFDIEPWINSGANLTLLSGSKNNSASNDSFDKKIKVYKGKGMYKTSNDGITSFRMTQKIVDDFNSELFEKEWNAYAIDDRWKWFCESVENILEIDLSTIKETEYE